MESCFLHLRQCLARSKSVSMHQRGVKRAFNFRLVIIYANGVGLTSVLATNLALPKQTMKSYGTYSYLRQ
jgi:hypothetical protein